MQHIGKTFYREAQRSGEGVKGFVRGFRRGQKEVDRPCGNDGRVAGGWLTLSLSLSLSFFLSLSVSLWPWPWRWGFLFQRKLTWFRQVLRRVSYFPNPRKHSTYPINSRVHIFHALITLILSVAFHVYWILCVWLFLIVNTADLIGNVDDEGGARRLDSDWKLVPHLIAHYLLVRVK